MVALEKRLTDFCMAVGGIPLILSKKTLHTSRGKGLALQFFPQRYVSRVLDILTSSASLLDLPPPRDPPPLPLRNSNTR